MSNIVSGKEALAGALFRIGALRFGRFTLSSGKTSSYYLDLRLIPGDPEAYRLGIEAYRTIAANLGEEIDVLAGVATAGVTISSPLAFVLKKPMVYVRREEKGHGLGKIVEGAVHPGWRALVIDDLVTTGGSLLSAVEALRKSGCVVKEAAVLVDRLEGGESALARAGVRLNSFADVAELVGMLYRNKGVTKGNHDAVLRQIRRQGV